MTSQRIPHQRFSLGDTPSKRSFCSVVMILVLLLCTSTANAWDAERYIDTWEELPESVRVLLPVDEKYVNGYCNGSTYFVLLEADDVVRTAYVLQPKDADGAYQIELKSAPLPPMNGYGASIGSSGTDYIYLIYDGGGSYYTFSREFSGAWLLGGVQATEDFGFSSVFGLAVHDEEYPHVFCLPGRTPTYDLALLEPNTMPKTVEEAIALVDTDGYAMVKSDVPTDRLHLRVSPSKQAASLGRYYSGTPVNIHSIKGDWAKVDVCGVEGYMMTEFLAFGQDMLRVKRFFPSLALWDEDVEKGVKVYDRPEVSTKNIVGTVGGASGRLAWGVYILANIGEDWFHVAFGNGMAGYIQSKHFWAGNG